MVLFEPGGQFRGDFDTSRLCHDPGEPGGTLHVAFPPAPLSYVPTKSFSRSKKPFSSFVGVGDADKGREGLLRAAEGFRWHVGEGRRGERDMECSPRFSWVMAQATRIEVPAKLAARFEENHGDFLEGLGGLSFSSTVAADGKLLVWVEPRDLEAALTGLAALGACGLSTFEEKSTDWVAESAALRRAVLVDRYLFDPHDADLATAPPPGVRRLFLPAVRAFGTGSHESTRLAVRLLLSEDLRRARVLDAGCGTGTLAFVAALEGARHVVAFDVDPHAE